MSQNNLRNIYQNRMRKIVGMTLGLVVVLVTILIAYIIYLKPENSSSTLDIVVLSENTVEVGSNYNIEQISDLTELRIRLQNTGNRPIYTNDYAEALTFEFAPDITVLEITKINSNPPDVYVFSSMNANIATLEPIQFNPQDQITLKLLVGHTVKKQGNAVFSINAKIAEVKEISRVSVSENSSSILTINLIAALIIVFVVFIITLALTLRRTSRYPVIRVDADRETIEKIIRALNK